VTNEKTFREMPKPLKNLKTAKSGDYGRKDIKPLAKHTISLAKRFRFVFASFWFRAKPEAAPKSLEIKIGSWAPRNPLKTLKTAEEMFGNVWRFQAKSLDKFGKSLEKAWTGGLRLGKASRA